MSRFDAQRSLARVYALVRSILLEIFDEAAYARFLSRLGVASSREAYRAFLDDQQAIKARGVRCC